MTVNNIPIDTLPKGVFWHMCSFLNLEDRLNLNMTCKKFSDWEKNCPFWQLIAESQLAKKEKREWAVEILRPIDFVKNYLKIKPLISDFEKGESVLKCVELYKNFRNIICALNISRKLLGITLINYSFEKIHYLLEEVKKELELGKEINVKNGDLKNFFVLLAEDAFWKLCSREKIALYGYWLATVIPDGGSNWRFGPHESSRG